MASDESEGDTRPLLFILRRFGDVTRELAVAYRMNGTAEEGADYRPLSGMALFPPGKSVVTIQVEVLNDVNAEGTESIQLEVVPPKPATAYDAPAKDAAAKDSSAKDAAPKDAAKSPGEAGRGE